MLVVEQDAPHLKGWIVRRLENTSDADTDVLADYCIALLRHDGDESTVRALFQSEIPDFLKEDSAAFVRDVFNAIKYKTYLPIGSSRKSFHPSNAPNLPVTLPAPVHSGEISLGGAPSGPLRDNKKRSYHDRADSPELRDYQSGADASGRSFKQLRRGGNAGRGGRFEDFGNFRGGMQNQQPSMSPSGLLPFPEAPPGLPPFDPNNPMAAFLAMQQMGFTLPGMPPLPEEGRAPAGRQPHQKRNQRCRDYDTKGFCARGASCKFEHGGDSIYVPPTALPTDEYDPTNASLMPGLEGPAMPNSTSQTPYVPQNGYTNDSGRGRGRGRGGIRGDRGGARGGRAEFSSDRANNDKSKTTIVVENIPEEKFTEEAVREFFSEFGEMVNIELRPYRHLAIIKYKEWAEANAAYRSPKVIFDNRFVKVYWYTDDSRLPQPPAGANASHTNGSHKIQGDDQEMSNATGAFTRATSEPKIDLEELARRQAEAQKLYEEKMKKKAEVEAKAKELEARQEELLKKQAEEKRKLMEKLAAKTKAAGGAGEGPEVTEEKKPMSQAEALKAQLAALEAEAKALGIDPAAATGQEDSWGGGYRGRGRGRGFYGAPRGTFPPRGAYRGRGGRGGAAPFAAVTSQYRLDNRPKKVALTGVDFTDLERDEALRHHLLGVGEYTELAVQSREKTTITFKDRPTAEKFVYGLPNGEIPGVAGKVEVAWVQTPLPPVKPPGSGAAGNADENQRPAAGSSKADDVMAVDEGHEIGAAKALSHAADAGAANGKDRGRSPPRQLDYDYADEDEWAS